MLRTDEQTEGRTDGVDRLLDVLLLSNDRLYNKIHAAKWHIKFIFQDLKPACQQRKKQLVDKNKLSNCLVLVMKINTHELRSLYIFLKPIQNITQYIFICYMTETQYLNILTQTPNAIRNGGHMIGKS